MKYVVFSFDDSREDTYTVAYGIMRKYGIKATVNVITEFVNSPEQFGGFEIACHGDSHKNTDKDVLLNIEKLKGMGVAIAGIGFASPNSYITEGNINDTGIDKLLSQGIISYIRTGMQIRREGIIYGLVSVLERFTHSKEMFYKLNKKNIISDVGKIMLLPSVAIKDYTTVTQIKYLLSRLKENESAILMFHSILNFEDMGYGKDHYYWDSGKFDALCSWLVNDSSFKVITTRELMNINHEV
jgi:peptidoglycan/xylan/chitin deacetylase (PgdA/CDA1 family)